VIRGHRLCCPREVSCRMNRAIGTLRLFHAAPVEGRQARSPLAVHEREAADPCPAASSPAPARSLPAALARYAPGPSAAQVGRRLRPGKTGTRQALSPYGHRPVCVRCGCHPQRKQRLKTAEILVAERDGEPPPAHFAPAEIVGVRVALDEVTIRDQVNRAAARWTVSQVALRVRGQPSSLQVHRQSPGIQYWMPGGERWASTSRCPGGIHIEMLASTGRCLASTPGRQALLSNRSSPDKEKA
jgi:hypothetical protein